MEGSYNLRKNKGCVMKWSSNFDDVSEEWAALQNDENFFMSHDMMRAISEVRPGGMECVFTVVMKDDRPIMNVISHLIDVDLLQSLSEEEDGKQTGWYQRLTRKIRRGITTKLKGTLLNFGHALFSGTRGIHFDSSLSTLEKTTLIQEVSFRLHNCLNREKRIIVLLVKDVDESNNFDAKNPLSCQFSELLMPPAMVLDLDPAWTTGQDYLDTLRSKYRVRAKKALKRSKGLEFRSLGIDDLSRYKNEIESLYREVVDQSSFNLFLLTGDYFVEMKRSLGDRFHVYGVFEEETLIGFYSFIPAYSTLEAHFLGYQADKAREYDLYLTILLFLIKEAIHHGLHQVYYARTAEEIKSSVGAKPLRYRNYLRHKSLLSNQLVPIVLHNIMPEEKYKLRNPFKKEA